MQTAVGFPVLIRAFRLTLTVEGLRPHTVSTIARRHTEPRHQSFLCAEKSKSPRGIVR